MRLLNFVKNNTVHLGIKTEQGIIDTAGALGENMPTDIEGVIRQGPEALGRLSALEKEAKQFIAEDDVVFAPCVTAPEKIICVGLNYMDHINEFKSDKPAYPVLFSKFSNALAAHKQSIRLPETAEKFDYEAELVIVTGKEASCITKDEALSYVFGYTAGNDLSARDLQMRTGQWLLGKSCDNFAPIGPYLVTADEIDPRHLSIRCEVNGEIRQSDNTSNMLFDCADIISYVSQYMTLKPGDIIFSGTPSGTVAGYPKEEQHWLKPGDMVSVSIEKIGTLECYLG